MSEETIQLKYPPLLPKLDEVFKLMDRSRTDWSISKTGINHVVRCGKDEWTCSNTEEGLYELAWHLDPACITHSYKAPTGKEAE